MVAGKSLNRKGCTSEKTIAVKALKEFIWYRVECKKEKNEIHVDPTVIYCALFDGWNECVVMTMNSKVEKGRPRQASFTELDGRYLRRAVANILKMA